MEYLSKLDSVGKFLGEWEVIYGGDKYKIVSEYLTKNMSDYVDVFSEALNGALEKLEEKEKNDIKRRISEQLDADSKQDLYALLKALENKNTAKINKLKEKITKNLLKLPNRDELEKANNTIQALEIGMFIVANVPGNIMPAFLSSKVGGEGAKFFGSGLKVLLKESLEGALDFPKYIKKCS
ncbi:hypothetical protein [Haliovirga abyssi]|uniref:Uncharacterized protein n=1 Tax=Haliovirga abyssi TaxID=2996794 RepID=A0AAU9DG85_9FUSO|nr:hypothetical protein [Haliovirga abyssi]BDU51248.1 hypothetical protein HLVA_18170 [Haliovirga abyssi]